MDMFLHDYFILPWVYLTRLKGSIGGLPFYVLLCYTHSMRRILLIGAFILANLFMFPPRAQAACYGINDATGVCDVGVECSTKPGVCCMAQLECKDVDPNDYNNVSHDTTGTGTGNSNTQTGVGFSPFGDCGGTSIDTAFGCINVSGSDFATTLLEFGVGIAGGIAMLLIIFGGFQILTIAGNPERLNEGRELISSAITGLLMIVFSVFLLRIIGIHILGIPQFN